MHAKIKSCGQDFPRSWSKPDFLLLRIQPSLLFVSTLHFYNSSLSASVLCLNLRDFEHWWMCASDSSHLSWVFFVFFIAFNKLGGHCGNRLMHHHMEIESRQQVFSDRKFRWHVEINPYYALKIKTTHCCYFKHGFVTLLLWSKPLHTASKTWSSEVCVSVSSSISSICENVAFSFTFKAERRNSPQSISFYVTLYFYFAIVQHVFAFSCCICVFVTCR